MCFSECKLPSINQKTKKVNALSPSRLPPRTEWAIAAGTHDLRRLSHGIYACPVWPLSAAACVSCTHTQTPTARRLQSDASEGAANAETHRKWVYHHTGLCFRRSCLLRPSVVDGRSYLHPTEKPYNAQSATAAIARPSSLEVGGLPFH